MWDDLHGPDVDELLEEAIEKPVKPPVTNNTNNTSSNNNTDKAAASSQKTSASKSGSSDKLAVKDKERERRKRHHHHHHKHSKEDPKKQNNASTTPTIPTEGAVATGSSTQQGTSISPTPEVITLTGGTDEPDSDAVAVKKRRARSKEFQNLRKQAMIAEDMNTIEEWEVDGVSQMEIKLSPSPYKDPPTEEELIALLKVKENGNLYGWGNTL